MGSATATRLGELLNGAYALEELVSAEDSLEIYRATEHKTGAGVRVTLLRPEYALQGAVVERLLRAPRSRENVVHQTLPSLRIETDDTGIPFMIEELVEGRPLEELLASFPQGLPLGLATHLALPLVEALALAHEHGLVHGAIDPTRLRWLGATTAPVPKLLELGAEANAAAACDVAYRAPELTGTARGSKQADVFALGVLLYRMLSGELPFRKGDKRPLPLDEVAPQLPAAWVELTTMCLDIDPKRRLAHAGELLTRMRACTKERGSAVAVEPVRDSRAKQVSALGFEDTAPESVPDERSAAPQARDSVPEVRKSTPVVRKPDEARKASEAAFAAATAKTQFVPAPAVASPKKPAEAAATAASAPKSVVAPAEAATVAAPVVSAATERTMSAVAAAFGTLSDDEDASKKDRKSSAKATADKLSAKSKARNGDANGDAKAAKPGSSTDKQPADRRSPQRPGNRNQPTQGQIAAVALTEAQLNALRALRNDNDESRDRWVGFFMMLFLMLLLQAGVPMLYEPNMAKAQAVFGTYLRVAAAGFSVVVVIATARMWAAQINGGSVVVRITSFAMQLVAVCICVLAATLFSHAPALGMFAGMARKALPWGMSGLFFLFAFAGALRGARDMTNNIVYGLLVMLLSTGSLYGSYRAIFSTVLAGTSPAQIAAARAARAKVKHDEHEELSPTEAARKMAETSLNAEADPEKYEATHQEVGKMEERHELGANEEDDLKATTEINNSRNANKDTIEKLQQAGPTIAQ